MPVSISLPVAEGETLGAFLMLAETFEALLSRPLTFESISVRGIVPPAGLEASEVRPKSASNNGMEGHVRSREEDWKGR